MEGDLEVKEAFREYEKQQQERNSARSAINKLSNKSIFLIIVLIIGFYYLAFLKEAIDPKVFYWVIVGIVAMMYMMAYKAKEENELIPEEKLKAILFNKLKWKQSHSPSEMPTGRIEIMLNCKLKKIEGVPVKYVIGFKIIQSNGLENTYVAEINPKNGYLLGFEEKHEGFKGNEVTDIAFIRRKEDVWQEKYFKGVK